MASLLSTLRFLKNLPARLAYRRALARRPFELPKGSAPRLSYGGVLEKKGVVHGGKVKLLHLRERFPENASFSLIYLVSSAYPPHALELVRWAKSKGAKLVWNQNGVAFPAWAGGATGEVNAPMAALLKEADFVVYQSAFCQQSADRFLGGAPCASAILINPVDLAAFSPAPEAPAPDCLELLTAGTHHQAYRVVGAIETLRLLLDAGRLARLTVAGELRWPRAQAEVAAALEKFRVADRVRFVPPFTQNEAVELYRGAHVLLHPKYHDPCPTVPIEAMACGVPVIASRSGGMPELLGENEGGRLIEVPVSWEKAAAPDPKAMAAAALELMENWPQSSRRARARAERCFGKTAWVDAHAALFEAVLKKTP